MGHYLAKLKQKNGVQCMFMGVFTTIFPHIYQVSCEYCPILSTDLGTYTQCCAQ